MRANPIIPPTVLVNDPIKPQNLSRGRAGYEALKKYATVKYRIRAGNKRFWADFETNCIDLVTDVLHRANQSGISADRILSAAKQNFDEEK